MPLRAVESISVYRPIYSLRHKPAQSRIDNLYEKSYKAPTEYLQENGRGGKED